MISSDNKTSFNLYSVTMALRVVDCNLPFDTSKKEGCEAKTILYTLKTKSRSY